MFHATLNSDSEMSTQPRPQPASVGVQVDVLMSEEIYSLQRQNEEQRRQMELLRVKADIGTKSASDRFDLMTNTPEKFLFYTGVTRGQFNFIFEFCEPDVYDMKMWGTEPEKQKKAQSTKDS